MFQDKIKICQGNWTFEKKEKKEKVKNQKKKKKSKSKVLNGTTILMDL